MTWILTLASVLAVSAVSLVGALTLAWEPNRVRRIAAHLVAFAVGGLYGDAFLHLIPEAFNRRQPITVSLLIVGGLLAFFVLEKVLRRASLHQRWHHLPPLAGINLFGDALHNAIDGMLIGASFAVGPALGATTSVAVLLHEVPQELGDFGILIHSGLSVRRALFYNFLSALTSVAGAALALVLGAEVGGFSDALVPLTAGGFIYLAGTDLLPELHHQPGGFMAGARQVALIAAGIALMVALRWLE